MKIIENNEITIAVGILNKGGVGIFPTDTAYGIGCRVDSNNAVERIFKIKGRSKKQALPVLVSSIEMAKKYIDGKFWEDFLDLASKYWPGGLTIVVPVKKEANLDLIKGEEIGVGFRMPNSKMILEMIEKIGVPIVGSSANFHGDKTPFCFNDLDSNLIKQVDFVIKGECEIRKPSTVVDIGVKPWRIVRQGAVVISSKFKVKSAKLSLKFKVENAGKKAMLYINTSKSDKVLVGLEIDGKKDFIEGEAKEKGAEQTLILLDKLLKRNNLHLRDIMAVEINTGPGSFTGLRIGMAIANVLGTFMNVSINGRKPGETVFPIY